MDIREILQSMSIDDRAIWSESRTNMRRAFLYAHNETAGIANWEAIDDAFMDLIDIRLAMLFDRAGRLNMADEKILNKPHAIAIEASIESAGSKLLKTGKNGW